MRIEHRVVVHTLLSWPHYGSWRSRIVLPDDNSATPSLFVLVLIVILTIIAVCAPICGAAEERDAVHYRRQGRSLLG